MSEEGMNPRRRRLLTITSGLGVIGTVFAATPFVLSMMPSARAKAAGAPVEVDISKIEPGQLLTVEWRGFIPSSLMQPPHFTGLKNKKITH